MRQINYLGIQPSLTLAGKNRHDECHPTLAAFLLAVLAVLIGKLARRIEPAVASRVSCGSVLTRPFN